MNIHHQTNIVHKLYDGLKKYHSQVKLTFEINPLRFLDTEIIHNNSMIETQVHKKKNKLPTPWTCKVPKRYEWNNIKARLYQKHISTNFTNE